MDRAKTGRLFLAVVAVLLSISGSLARATEKEPIRVAISFSSTYLGMPIWVRADTPRPYKIHYPSSTTPSDFGCNTLAVKREGSLIAADEHPNQGWATGAACGWVSAPDSPESRLPLHLQYSLSEPGHYLVRYRRYEVRVENGHIVRPVVEQSDWTPLVLQAAPPGAIQEWRSSLLTNLPTSPGMLVGDALPSLLANRDRSVFRAMLQATYNHNEVVSMYASNSTPMFDPIIVRNETVTAIRRDGPNDAMAYAFTSYRSVFAPIADEVANLSIEYLRRGTPEQVSAAVHLLYILREPEYRLRAATISELDNSLYAAVDGIVERKNENAALWLARFLPTSKSPNAYSSLWKLANAHLATEQTLICITWLHNPDDLPKLVEIAETYEPTDPYGYHHEAIVGNLRTAYGDAVRPYLREILEKSKQVWVRVAAAKELALMNDSTGNQFFIATLQQRPFYHDELVRWLRDAFPAIHDADETNLIEFLDTRSRNGSEYFRHVVVP